MIGSEPIIHVGIAEHRKKVSGSFPGGAVLGSTEEWIRGKFKGDMRDGEIELNVGGQKHAGGRTIEARCSGDSEFLLKDVIIGVGFHWEQKEDQAFRGNLHLVADGEGITAVNDVRLEEYLCSVISSEMSATSPPELLKAHAITSRSWLVAVLERQQKAKNLAESGQRTMRSEGELIRWYDREDHPLFDVCADDHCQRYQGVTKIVSRAARDAVAETRGVFLVHNNEICDARYSKACGGISEDYANVWEEKTVPYLRSITDGPDEHARVHTEEEVEHWVLEKPEAYCNTADASILRTVLPAFDRKTTNFFRWTVRYEGEKLDELVKRKSGIDFGEIVDLIPVQRGPSGRLVRLKVVGTKRSLIVGKELEIRKWFSSSHLYSSAFLATADRNSRGKPLRWTLKGAGWGHGVGLCQIGAAVMATKGKKAVEILKHYFRGAELAKLYD